MKPTTSKIECDELASCSPEEHHARTSSLNDEACERAAAIFRALGDPQRLRILMLLESTELCVSELQRALGDPMPAISQRLRLLRSERVLRSRRDGKHIYYSLADDHIARLITNGLLHALEH